MRRPALPALNAAHLSRRASLRGHTPVAATARRPPAVESLLLAARRGDARARFSRPLGRPPRSRRPDTQPPLDAAACASCAERGASLAPCFSARSHARGRDGSTAARRRVAAARRLSRQCSRALLAPARSAAAFALADTQPPLDAPACASCAEHGAFLAPCFSAWSHARGRDGSTAPAVESLLLAARRGDARARCSRPLGRPPRSRRLDTQPPLDAAACASCAARGAFLSPCFSARSHARGRDGSTAARRRVAAAHRSSWRYSRALLAPARSAAAFATARHSAAARRGGLRFRRCTRRISRAVLLCAVPRPWPRRLDGRPPSSCCCSPLVAATLACAARARSVGRRVHDGPTLNRRSTRRPALPALNTARFLRRASLRGHTPVAATARRPPAVESLLLAARHGNARARCSSPLGRQPRSRRLDTQPPLDAAACTSGPEYGASLAPRFSVTRPWPRRLDGRPPSSRGCSPLVSATLTRAARARSIGRRVRDGSTLGRRSTRRPALPALNTAHLSRRASLRGPTPVAATARRPPAVESLLLAARRGDAHVSLDVPSDHVGCPPRRRPFPLITVVAWGGSSGLRNPGGAPRLGSTALAFSSVGL